MPEKERDNAKDLLSGLDEMAEEAPGVGLCSLPFKLLRQKAEVLIEERYKLAAYRLPRMVKPYTGYAGQCPSCGVVFLDDSTHFCGNCGQAILFPEKEIVK